MYIKKAEIISLPKVDSTNFEAQRILKKERISSPLWIIADEQTKGKGRSGKKWISNKGNLFASLILPISFDVKNLPMLSCVIALATHECLNYFLGQNEHLKIKWPNDILFEDSKLSGILIENLLSAESNYSIVGVGVNVNSSPLKLDHLTTSLKSIVGITIDIKSILNQLSISLDKYISNLENEELDNLIKDFILKSWRFNKEVQFVIGKNICKGRILSISNNFEIEIITNNGIKKFNSGELSFKY